MARIKQAARQVETKVEPENDNDVVEVQLKPGHVLKETPYGGTGRVRFIAPAKFNTTRLRSRSLPVRVIGLVERAVVRGDAASPAVADNMLRSGGSFTDSFV